MLQTQQLDKHLYAFTDDHVRQFLLTAPDKAILLDTGYSHSHVREAVRAITDVPVQVLLTHGDPDHAGGVADFGEVWLHEKDWPLVQAPVKLHPLHEGDIFCCGEFQLEVVEIPGHTYGSVAFLDRAKGLLFSGDSVQKDGPIYLFGSHRNLNLYLASQQKLLDLSSEVKTVFPCHHDCPIGPEYIGKNLDDAKALRAGLLPSVPTSGMPCRTYQGKWTAFYCTEEDRTRT